MPIDNFKYDLSFNNDFSSISNFLKCTYGLNLAFRKYALQRFECPKNNYFFKLKKDKLIILRLFRSFISRRINLKKNIELSLFNLFKINSFKAWRHVRGLPSRGQRTWSNASSSYLSNVTLRKFIYNLAKRTYIGSQASISNVAYLAEYSNVTWKQQWFSEWNELKDKRVNTTGKFNVFKVDLYLMSRFNVRVEKEQKVLSKRARRKKKKLEIKNTLVSGFELGFTKSFLKKSNVGLRTNKIQLITSKVVQKNKRFIKKKIDKNKKLEEKKKKKKKSVWD